VATAPLVDGWEVCVSRSSCSACRAWNRSITLITLVFIVFLSLSGFLDLFSSLCIDRYKTRPGQTACQVIYLPIGMKLKTAEWQYSYLAAPLSSRLSIRATAGKSRI